MTREEIRAAMTDETALVATLFGEAAGEPIDGLIAVASVIRNRALSPRWWGTGYRGVCLAKSQFSCWWETNANSERVYAVADALIAGGPSDERSTLSEIRWVAAGVMGEQLKDLSMRSDHYLTQSLFRSTASPAWAKGRIPVTRVGSHAFFRLEL